jgi:hypothetical protein
VATYAQAQHVYPNMTLTAEDVEGGSLCNRLWNRLYEMWLELLVSFHQAKWMPQNLHIERVRQWRRYNC